MHLTMQTMPVRVFKTTWFANRSIVLAKGGRYWVYEYLFAKKDRDNIDDDELMAFRALAKSYAGMTDLQLAQLLSGKDLVEICHDDKAQVQE